MSVVLVTWNRPVYVAENLAHLHRLDVPADEIVVVDASRDARTRAAVDAYPGVRYVRFPAGAGHMTTARNEGLLHTTADVIAFLDDDAYVAPSWLEAVVGAFSDASVGAVSGRTTNKGDEKTGDGPIGRFLPDGSLTGNFDADVHDVVDVDHGIGANMSFRRGVLADLGGFRDDYPGTALREDTDMFLRVKALGYRAVFVPQALAHHVAAPHVRGKRFDWRYQFWGYHNHLFLLLRHRGFASLPVWRWAFRELVARSRTVRWDSPRTLTRPLLCVPALLLATVKALAVPTGRRSVVRSDAVGRRVRQHLSEPTSPGTAAGRH